MLDGRPWDGGLVLSYLWEVIMLPIHAWHLASIRLLYRRRLYEMRLEMRQEWLTLKETVGVELQMEAEIASADLALGASREVAAEALRGGLERLRLRVGVPPDGQGPGRSPEQEGEEEARGGEGK